MMTFQQRVFALALTSLLAAGCKKSQWIEGKWLLVTPEGRPGVCHEFKGGKKRVMLIYTGTKCSGPTDPLLSGKWQLQAENKLAILQGTEEEGKPVVITEHDKKHFVASGGISGKLWRVGEDGAEKVLDRLEQEGEIKLKALPPEMGCRHLSMALKDIKALPTEPKPRMIRRRDEGLEYHVDKATGDPKVEKVVFALNQEVIEWVAYHLTPNAFQPPGPEGRQEAAVGKPEGSATTGKDQKTQRIVMWRTYCAKLRGANNKDVDVTLFSTPGQQRGTIYVSENIISDIWDDLKATIKEAPPPEDDEEEGEGGGGDTAKAAPAPPPKAAPAPAPAPKAAPAPPPTPKAAPKPAPKPADDDDEI
jgi:hypothetical protein